MLTWRHKKDKRIDAYMIISDIMLERRSLIRTLYEIIAHPFFQSTPDIFALRAISVLSSRKQAVLVIDDLHLIHDSTVLQFLLVSIKRLPKNFQIVLFFLNAPFIHKQIL